MPASIDKLKAKMKAWREKRAAKSGGASWLRWLIAIALVGFVIVLVLTYGLSTAFYGHPSLDFSRLGIQLLPGLFALALIVVAVGLVALIIAIHKKHGLVALLVAVVLTALVFTARPWEWVDWSTLFSTLIPIAVFLILVTILVAIIHTVFFAGRKSTS